MLLTMSQVQKKDPAKTGSNIMSNQVSLTEVQKSLARCELAK